MPNLIMRENLSRNYILQDNIPHDEFSEIKLYCNYLKIPENCKLFIHQNECCILKLTDSTNNELLSIMRLVKYESCGLQVYKVDKVKSMIERKGYGQFLYEYSFIHLDRPIMSDGIQTRPGSFDLWKKLHRLQDTSPYEILIFNEQVLGVREYNRNNVWSDYEIWGWHKEFIEMLRLDDQCLDDGLQAGDLNKEIYYYIKNNEKKIKDRTHIKLVGRKREASNQVDCPAR